MCFIKIRALKNKVKQSIYNNCRTGFDTSVRTIYSGGSYVCAIPTYLPRLEKKLKILLSTTMYRTKIMSGKFQEMLIEVQDMKTVYLDWVTFRGRNSRLGFILIDL